MKTFQQILRAERPIGFLQVDQRLFGVFGNRREGILAESAHAQHVEHQHAMIGGDGPPAFGNDGGVRYLSFVANVLDVIDHIVSVFLQRVIDAGFEIGLRAVVIDAEPAANVEVFQARRRRVSAPRKCARPPLPRP